MLARHIGSEPEVAALPRGAEIVVLVNRAARSSARPGWEPVVRKVLSRRLTPHFLYPADGDEMAAAARASAAGAAAIMVAGGDGSINRVASAVAGLGIPLAILPLGTANDLARELGIPERVVGAARRVLDGTIRRLDLVEVNGARYCTVGGLGMAATCALGLNRLRARSPALRRALGALGRRVYPAAAAASVVLGAGSAETIRIVLRDAERRTRTIDVAAETVLAANQASLGGLALPCRSANDDGLFELCVVHAGSRLRLLRSLAHVAAGHAFPPEAVSVHRVREARIECESPVSFFGDGDELSRDRSFLLRVRRGALAVIC